MTRRKSRFFSFFFCCEAKRETRMATFTLGVNREAYWERRRFRWKIDFRQRWRARMDRASNTRLLASRPIRRLFVAVAKRGAEEVEEERIDRYTRNRTCLRNFRVKLTLVTKLRLHTTLSRLQEGFPRIRRKARCCSLVFPRRRITMSYTETRRSRAPPTLSLASRCR